ncbi:hypothetical protein FRB90_012062 [Tulasnella sp. 427]|nr:hypothetical protein FRB90_012062 [Tulasnella sp. 427]
MNMNAHIFEQPLTEFPDIPPEFGQDGGKFNYFYDQVADELDDDLVKRLKAQLDSLLIFAGLFAGVNSAFLALTLPMMSADPADDTNALLLQLVKGGNSSITSAADLPSANFTPAPTMYPVNLLFAASLTFALMSSFLAALGQQWLVYYRKRSGGGPDHQRREQLKRQLGAERWRLELVLDDILPALLQIGLVIFSISFVIYLRTISHSMSIVIAGIVGTGLIFTFGAAICTTWDRMCPYQSPLSHLLCWMVDQAKPFFSVAAALIVWLLPLPRGCIFRAVKILSEPGSDLTGLYNPFTWKDNYSSRWRLANAAASLALSRVGRHEETAANLTAASIKKVILTSESPNALIHASANLCAIRNKEALKALNEDEEILNRLYDLIEADGHKWSPATQRDARDSNTPTKDRTLLRQLKSRYVESLMLMPTLDKQAQLAAYSIAPYSDLWDLLADALFGIRKLAAQEPGHRENHITLRLFGLLLIKAQQWSLESRFIQEYKEFEEWANEGGCAKTPGRLNRDPDISWCDYHDILSYHS